MEMNRNHYFFLGVLILLVGIQARSVSSFLLTANTTRFLAERTSVSSETSPFSLASTSQAIAPQLTRKLVKPPEWLGWCLISFGGVLVLHSLAMKKPD